jgi:hypothetical protein
MANQHETDGITEALTDIIEQESTETLRTSVAQQALDYGEPDLFFSDLIENGCASGMITDLIRREDIHQFFDTHYDEIEEIRTKLDNAGRPIEIKGNSRDCLSWTAVEITAVTIAVELGLVMLLG